MQIEAREAVLEVWVVEERVPAGTVADAGLAEVLPDPLVEHQRLEVGRELQRISPVFKDLKNGKLKIISFFAKKARGSMTRYVINTNAQTLDDIKGFDYDGYRFSQQETTKEHAPVFIR